MSKRDVAHMFHHDVSSSIFRFFGQKKKFCNTVAVISRATHILCAPEFSHSAVVQ